MHIKHVADDLKINESDKNCVDVVYDDVDNDDADSKEKGRNRGRRRTSLF